MSQRCQVEKLSWLYFLPPPPLSLSVCGVISEGKFKTKTAVLKKTHTFYCTAFTMKRTITKLQYAGIEVPESNDGINKTPEVR